MADDASPSINFCNDTPTTKSFPVMFLPPLLFEHIFPSPDASDCSPTGPCSSKRSIISRIRRHDRALLRRQVSVKHVQLDILGYVAPLSFDLSTAAVPLSKWPPR